MDISITLPGKDEACSSGVIARLKLVLSSESTDAVAVACAALSAIAITTDGKKQAVKDGVVAVLAPPLSSADERATPWTKSR